MLVGLEYIKTLVNGLKKRIENIPQSDWKQNDETAQSYIKNRIGGYVKPVEETVVVKRADAESSSYWGKKDGLSAYQEFVPCDEIPTEEELANAVPVGGMYNGTAPLSVFRRNENCYYLNFSEISDDDWGTDKAYPPLAAVYKDMGRGSPGIAFSHCYDTHINVGIDTLTYKTTKDKLIKIPAEYVDSTVQYDTEQSLTEKEQLQARNNIGCAGGYIEVIDGSNMNSVYAAVDDAYKYKKKVYISRLTTYGEVRLYPPTSAVPGSVGTIYDGAALLTSSGTICAYRASVIPSSGPSIYIEENPTILRTFAQSLTAGQKAQARSNIGLTPVAKTDEMTQSVGLEAETGKLWTAPPTGDNIVLASSTAGSTKKFRIAVDDSGTLSAVEVTDAS